MFQTRVTHYNIVNTGYTLQHFLLRNIFIVFFQICMSHIGCFLISVILFMWIIVD